MLSSGGGGGAPARASRDAAAVGPTLKDVAGVGGLVVPRACVCRSDQAMCARCSTPVCLQERFYFGDGVLPLFESGIPLLLDRLKRLPDKDKV